MTKDTLRIFREEDNGGGGTAFDLLNEPATPVAAPAGEPQPAPAAPAPTFDADAIGRAIAANLPKAPAPEPPKMTREEARKQLGFMDIDDNFIAKYDNLESRKAAMQELYENQLTVAANIARANAEAMREELRGEFGPAKQHLENYHAEQREKRFNEQNPDLAKPEFRPMIASVVQHLQSTNALQGKDESAIFKLIADTTTGIIKQSNPNFAPTAPAAPQRAASTLPTTSSGSGGAGGKSVAQGQGKPKALTFL